MIALGINGGVRLGYQDISAALVIDGKLVAAVEEERFNRIKHSPGQLPELSVRSVLGSQGLSISDVDVVATHGITWGETYEQILQDYFTHTFGHCPTIVRVHHHDAHAASTFYASGYDEAMIVTMDTSGDGVSTQLSIGRASEMSMVTRIARPDSLGMFYSLMSQYCGFTRDKDEYKLMGLSAYGDAGKHNFDWLLKVDRGRFSLDAAYLKEVKPGEAQPTRQQMMFNDRLIKKLGPMRLPGTPIEQIYKDIAGGAQRQIEKAIIELVTEFHRETGLRKLCLAGGVALNCVANGKLMNLDFIDAIYVQPGSSDAGVSIGAAFLAAAQNGDRPQSMHDAYLGPGYSNADIEAALKAVHLTAESVDDPAQYAAEGVASDKVVGWFQGRMEFGPRALGSRSILANPGNAAMKDIVNRAVKFRESFRPFCPSVLEEDKAAYFHGKQKVSPYMNITYAVEPSMIPVIPAVTHVDHTARVQTVNQVQHPLYYQFLQRLRNLTGHGVCLNTSLNVDNQPIVTTPLHAISTFFSCGMDTLVIGNYVLEKQPARCQPHTAALAW